MARRTSSSKSKNTNKTSHIMNLLTNGTGPEESLGGSGGMSRASADTFLQAAAATKSAAENFSGAVSGFQGAVSNLGEMNAQSQETHERARERAEAEKARAEAETEKARAEAEAERARAEAEKIRAEAEEARSRAEAEAKAAEEARLKAKDRAEMNFHPEESAEISADERERIRREAEEKVRREMEDQFRAEAEQKVREEYEKKQRDEEEAARKIREEAEEAARKKLEEEQRIREDERAKAEAELKARHEAEEKLRAEAEEKAKEKLEAEMEAKARAEAEVRRRAEEEARKAAEDRAMVRRDMEMGSQPSPQLEPDLFNVQDPANSQPYNPAYPGGYPAAGNPAYGTPQGNAIEENIRASKSNMNLVPGFQKSKVTVVNETSENDKISNEIRRRLESEAEKEQKETEPNFHIVNVMSAILDRKNILGYMQKYGGCTCERCQADVKALCLTKLPSKYVVLDRDKTSPMIGFYQSKYDSWILAAIIKACIEVKEHPHHDAKRGAEQRRAIG